MRSLYDAIVSGSQVVHQVSGAAALATGTGAALDTKGYSTGVLEASVGLNSGTASPSAVVSLLECATSNGTFTPALANDGTAIGFTLTGNWSGGALAAGMARIEGLGLNRLRYLKAQIVSTVNAASTIPEYAQITLGRAQLKPTQTSSAHY